MRRPPPVKVGKLQTALHTKAKNSPDYRFYARYDKVYRRDVLEWAFWPRLRNGGVPGVDGQSLTLLAEPDSLREQEGLGLAARGR